MIQFVKGCFSVKYTFLATGYYQLIVAVNISWKGWLFLFSIEGNPILRYNVVESCHIYKTKVETHVTDMEKRSTTTVFAAANSSPLQVDPKSDILSRLLFNEEIPSKYDLC